MSFYAYGKVHSVEVPTVKLRDIVILLATLGDV
jgi:hypothetical protein